MPVRYSCFWAPRYNFATPFGSVSVMNRQIKTQPYAPRPQAFALLCVLLILFAGFAQANHVHAGAATSSNHECSVCAVAHAGAIVNVVSCAVPVFQRTILVVRKESSPKSLLLAAFLYIRPPPSV